MNRRHFVSLSTSTLATLVVGRQGRRYCGSLTHNVDDYVQTLACPLCSAVHSLTVPSCLEVPDV